MIKIYLGLDTELNKKVQDKIYRFINYFVEGLEECDSQEDEDYYYEIVFPKFIVRHNRELCKKVIMDLRDWSKDLYVHTLKPLYEYVFFYILQYCEDIDKDVYKDRKESLFDMYYDLDLSQFDCEDENDLDEILKLEIHTFDFYIEYCFLDQDFLAVPMIYEIYKKSPIVFKSIGVELDEYIDLMPPDIAEEYKKIKKENEEKIEEVKNNMIDEQKIPKVFVSYSWDSEEHKRWVLQLVSTLRKYGVNAIIDEAQIQKETVNLNSMMLKNIQQSDYILVIMTENYAFKADNESGGVGFETQSLVNCMRENIGKIIPILKDKSDKSIPFYLKGVSYIDLSDQKSFNSNFKKLLYKIYKKDVIELSPIGERPNFETDKIESFDIDL